MLQIDVFACNATKTFVLASNAAFFAQKHQIFQQFNAKKKTQLKWYLSNSYNMATLFDKEHLQMEKYGF